MAMKIIKEDCIDCSLCIPECPDGGISILQINERQYEHVIDSYKCTECIEFNKKSKCLNVCPVDSINNEGVKEEDHILWEKVKRNK